MPRIFPRDPTLIQTSQSNIVLFLCWFVVVVVVVLGGGGIFLSCFYFCSYSFLVVESSSRTLQH